MSHCTVVRMLLWSPGTGASGGSALSPVAPRGVGRWLRAWPFPRAGCTAWVEAYLCPCSAAGSSVSLLLDSFCELWGAWTRWAPWWATSPSLFVTTGVTLWSQGDVEVEVLPLSCCRD